MNGRPPGRSTRPRVLGVIPARGGSEETSRPPPPLPLKNLVEISGGGRPMIDYVNRRWPRQPQASTELVWLHGSPSHR